jgi:hypothetical protein
MITVEVERMSVAAAEGMIDRVWSGAEWGQNLPGLSGLAVEYDDGQRQSVQLCFAWRGGHIAMSVIRFRDSPTRIAFFYSRLAPGVARQTGVWEARPVAGGSCLRLWRSLELRRGHAENTNAFQARESAYRPVLKESARLVLDQVMRSDLLGLESCLSARVDK